MELAFIKNALLFAEQYQLKILGDIVQKFILGKLCNQDLLQKFD